jgi:hypothetical protein
MLGGIRRWCAGLSLGAISALFCAAFAVHQQSQHWWTRPNLDAGQAVAWSVASALCSGLPLGLAFGALILRRRKQA